MININLLKRAKRGIWYHLDSEKRDKYWNYATLESVISKMPCGTFGRPVCITGVRPNENN